MAKVLAERIKEILEEFMGKAEIFGNLTFEIVDIENPAFVKGNRIYLSRKLEELSDKALKYVVAHELAHLAVRGHKERFWEVLRNLYPEYEEGQRELYCFFNDKKSS
jgi:predicted SprT family Zn-dependent metalloprotease